MKPEIFLTPVNAEIWKAREREPSGNLLPHPALPTHPVILLSAHSCTCEGSVVMHLPLGSLEASTMLITREASVSAGLSPTESATSMLVIVYILA